MKKKTGMTCEEIDKEIAMDKLRNPQTPQLDPLRTPVLDLSTGAQQGIMTNPLMWTSNAPYKSEPLPKEENKPRYLEIWDKWKKDQVNITKDYILISQLIEEAKLKNRGKTKMNDSKRVLIPVANLDKVRELNISPTDIVNAYLTSVAEGDPNVFYKELIANVEGEELALSIPEIDDQQSLIHDKIVYAPNMVVDKVTVKHIDNRKYGIALQHIKESLDNAIKGNLVHELLRTHDVEIVEPFNRNTITVVLTDNRKTHFNTIFDQVNAEHWKAVLPEISDICNGEDQDSVRAKLEAYHNKLEQKIKDVLVKGTTDLHGNRMGVNNSLSPNNGDKLIFGNTLKPVSGGMTHYYPINDFIDIS